jgi:hypothetical protein
MRLMRYLLIRNQLQWHSQGTIEWNLRRGCRVGGELAREEGRLILNRFDHPRPDRQDRLGNEWIVRDRFHAQCIMCLQPEWVLDRSLRGAGERKPQGDPGTLYHSKMHHSILYQHFYAAKTECSSTNDLSCPQLWFKTGSIVSLCVIHYWNRWGMTP